MMFSLYPFVALLLLLSLFTVSDALGARYSCSISTSDELAPAGYRSFQTGYADGSSLSGVVVSDVVQVGPYYVPTYFGAVTHTVGNWDTTDGIIGFAFPGAGSSSIPNSWFDSVTNSNNAGSNSNLLSTKIFTLALANSTRTSVLMLGGYDPAAAATAINYVPVLPMLLGASIIGNRYTYWGAAVSRIRFGSVPNNDLVDLMSFKSGVTSYPGVLDSGTSCLMLPNTADSYLANQPFNAFLGYLQSNTRNFYNANTGTYSVSAMRSAALSFTFTMGGVDYSVALADWLIAMNGQLSICVGSGTFSSGNIMLLGDPFFRSNLVIHDTTQASPRIGLAALNKGYFTFNLDNGIAPAVSAAAAASVESKMAEAQPGFATLPLERRVMDTSHLPATANTASQADTIQDENEAILHPHFTDMSHVYHPAAQLVEATMVRSVAGVTNTNLTFVNGIQYMVNVQVGNPRTNSLSLLLDTGSTVLAVFSQNCSSAMSIFPSLLLLIAPFIVSLIGFVF